MVETGDGETVTGSPMRRATWRGSPRYARDVDDFHIITFDSARGGTGRRQGPPAPPGSATTYEAQKRPVANGAQGVRCSDNNQPVHRHRRCIPGPCQITGLRCHDGVTDVAATGPAFRSILPRRSATAPHRQNPPLGGRPRGWGRPSSLQARNAKVRPPPHQQTTHGRFLIPAH